VCTIQLRQVRLLQPINEPPIRGIRSDLGEQIWVVAQRGQVGKTVPTVGDHHSEIPEHGAGVRLTDVGKHRREHL
jgi:hypothetical protein